MDLEFEPQALMTHWFFFQNGKCNIYWMIYEEKLSFRDFINPQQRMIIFQDRDVLITNVNNISIVIISWSFSRRVLVENDY